LNASLPSKGDLASEIAAARWYGGKGAPITGVEEDDRLELEPGIALHVLRIERGDAPVERYLYLSGEERVGQAVLDAIVRGARHGDWSFEPGVTLPGLLPGDRSERPIGHDQSNTSIVLGERLVLKLYRRLERGAHPDIEIGRYLTEQASIAFVPAYAGCVRWQGHAIAMLQSYVCGAEEGWQWAGEAVIAGQTADFERLGANTATLHRALAGLASRTAGPAELAEWRHSAELQLERVLRLVDGDVGEELAGFAPRLREEFASLERPAEPPVLSRVHGDYHVGQVLRSGDGSLRVVDFEGEPTKSLDERIRLGTPLRDVAAMLRSFDHLARHVDRDLHPGHLREIEGWIDDARSRFLHAYGPHDPVLLRALEVEKETYEFVYAATFLPDWMYAAVGGMRWLMGMRT
jgi:predicted trehalose synthase